MKVVCRNSKAFRDYFIEEVFEAGIALLGTEVKSLREGRANLKDSYVAVRGSEAFLINCHISPYSHGNLANHEPLRTRKLLLKGREIERLRGLSTEKGYSIVPLRIYFKGHLAKAEVALVKGKKLFDKREAVKEREARREIDRALKTSR